MQRANKQGVARWRLQVWDVKLEKGSVQTDSGGGCRELILVSRLFLSDRKKLEDVRRKRDPECDE